jgi:hypothetical protein
MLYVEGGRFSALDTNVFAYALASASLLHGERNDFLDFPSARQCEKATAIFLKEGYEFLSSRTAQRLDNIHRTATLHMAISRPRDCSKNL